MKRSVSEILRRGFESMLANWPLIIIRIIESVVMIIIVIVAIVAVIVPFVISMTGETSFPSVNNPTEALSAVLSFIGDHAAIILYVLMINLVVLTVWIMVHSFVTAGTARVFVDSMQRTIANPLIAREELNAFTTQRWFDGAKASWWTVFWIYNIAWSVGLMLMLLPMAALVALIILLRENGPAAMITGCVGILLGILFLIPIGIVTSIWTQKAIVDCVTHATGAMDSLQLAWTEFRSDMGRHLAIAIIMMVVSFGGAILVGSLGSMAGWGHEPSLMMVPLQFSSSILNSIVGAAVGAWFLACFAALAVEPA